MNKLWSASTLNHWTFHKKKSLQDIQNRDAIRDNIQEYIPSEKMIISGLHIHNVITDRHVFEYLDFKNEFVTIKLKNNNNHSTRFPFPQ